MLPNRLVVIPDNLFQDGTLDATTFQPTSSFSISNGLHADLIGVVPGSTERLLVYRNNAGLSVFDEGVERGNQLNNVNTFAFDDLTGDAFACNRSFSGLPLYRLAIDENGVTVAQTLPSSLQQAHSDMQFENGLLYYDRGLVVSAALANEVQRFPTFNFSAGGRVQPATDRNLVYFTTGSAGKWSLRAFRSTTTEPVGTVELSGAAGTLSRLSRWSQTGLAFATSSNQLFLLRNVFTTDGSEADLAIHKLSAPRTGVPGQTAVYTCSITNRSAQFATATVVTQTFGFIGGLESIQVSTGSFQTNGSQIVWTVGNLAGYGSAEIEVQVLPTVAQTITNLTVVGSATLDPTSANNLAQAYTTVRDYSTNSVATTFPLAAADLVYDPIKNLLWASITNSHGGGAVVPIDPVEGVVGPGFNIGSEVTKLGVAGDGIHLYAVLPTAGGVLKINTTNSQWNQFTSLGFHPNSTFHVPLDLSVSPTNPLQVAVSYYSPSSAFSNFVAAVSDGTLLPDIGRSPARADVIEFAGTADQIYGFNHSTSGFQLSTYAVTNAGFIYTTNRTGLISGFNADIKRAGSRLYGAAGQVVDPRNHILITNLASTMAATAVEAVVADTRLYFATKNPYTIRILNLTNFTRLATNTLTGISGDVRSLVRWGVNGLAMHTTGGQIVLWRSPQIPAPGGQDTDGDGIPDDWESRFGLNPYDSIDATLDFDADGLNNLAEYLAGTDPYDSLSTLRIKRASLQETNFVFVFGSVTGRTYSVESWLEPADGTGWNTILSGITGTGNDITNQLERTPPNVLLRIKTQP